MFGSAKSEHRRLTNGEIISDVFQPMWSQSTNVTDRRTDGQRDRQTTCGRNTVLCTKVHRAIKMYTGIIATFQTSTWRICQLIGVHRSDIRAGDKCNAYRRQKRQSSGLNYSPPPEKESYTRRCINFNLFLCTLRISTKAEKSIDKLNLLVNSELVMRLVKL